jgi:antitoxin component HigA of HigAB toxin-antitoxin module
MSLERTALMATKLSKSVVADDYLELVKRFPLVPIKNDRHLREAHEVIDKLSMIGEERMTDGQADYLIVLGDLTMAYESDAFEQMTKDVTGPDVLKHLVEEHGLSASDVGRIIGQRELGPKIFKGTRQISREHAKALGRHFGLPAEIFLR